MVTKAEPDGGQRMNIPVILKVTLLSSFIEHKPRNEERGAVAAGISGMNLGPTSCSDGT